MELPSKIVDDDVVVTKSSDADSAVVASLLHAVSNKEKIRGDVDGVAFLKNVNGKGDEDLKKSREDTKGHDERERVEEAEPTRPRDPPDESTAQNLFSHLKNISARVEREDEERKPREDEERKPSPRRQTTPPKKYTDGNSDSDEEKAILLQTYHLLQSQGIKSDMRLDMTADIVIIKSEVVRMQTELNSQKSIKFMRKFLIAFVSGLEFLNSRYDPVGAQLEGWSEHVMTTLGDYDSCFIKLYDKYKNTTTAISPEVELLLLLGGSGVMFHMTQSFMNQNVPKFTEVARESPELAEKIAGIMAAKYNKAPTYDSSDEEDDAVSTSGARVNRPGDGKQKVSLPTDMLSTPAFPSMIQNMLNPRPQFTPPSSKIPKPKLQTIPEVREIDTTKAKIKTPLTEKSENVLVL
tara:strand:+ start:4070 stop:5293 length:1224 start_codon:yes stop_codon:yes gene_type:complete